MNPTTWGSTILTYNSFQVHYFQQFLMFQTALKLLLYTVLYYEASPFFSLFLYTEGEIMWKRTQLVGKLIINFVTA